MKSQTPKRIKSTSQATLHTNPGGDNRWRPEVRFFAKTAKRIKSTSPGKTKKPKNESSLQARAPPPKPKRAPGSIRERSERVRYCFRPPFVCRPFEHKSAQEPDLGQYSQTNRVCPFYRYVGASLPATISIQALQVPTYQSAAPPKEASSRGRQVVAASQDRTYGFLYRQNPRAFTNFLSACTKAPGHAPELAIGMDHDGVLYLGKIRSERWFGATLCAPGGAGTGHDWALSARRKRQTIVGGWLRGTLTFIGGRAP